MAEITIQDKILGKLAVRNNLISQMQLDECFQLITKSKTNRPLGVVMLSKGYITDDILEDLTKIQHKNEEQRELYLNRRMEDIILKKLILREKILSKPQIKSCIFEQQKLEELGQYLRLGQVMVRKKYLTTKEFLKLLETQKNLLFRCKNCEASFELVSALTGKKFRCANCETIITIPDILKNIQYPKRTSTITRGFHPLKSLRDRILELKKFGRYTVLEEIARGGMGIVFLAKDEKNRSIALKILKEGESSRQDQIRRFQREADSASKLDHPNIVKVYETGVEEECHYFTMEYVQGVALDESEIQEELNQQEFLEILATIGDALHYAHKKGIIHRDIKPANILIERKTKKPKLTDFGLAKDMDRQTMLTQSGAMVGTLYYMSPEQVKGGGRKIDGRTDIYALGVILYEHLTGSLPFSGETTLEIYDKIVNAEPVPPRDLNENIEPNLQNIILKALSKDPQNRYRTGEEFAVDLRKYLAGEKVSAKADFIPEKIQRLFVRNLGSILAVFVCGFLLLAIIVGSFLFYEYSQNKSYQNQFDLGLYYEREGKYEEAQKQFLSAGTIFPKKVEPLLAYTRASLQLGMLKDASTTIQKILELEPNHPQAHFLFGKNFYLLGQKEKGEKQIEAFEATKKNFIQCRKLLNEQRQTDSTLFTEIKEIEQAIQEITQNH
ncbi:MAG: protein kinase [Planctomycetota bacterium]